MKYLNLIVTVLVLTLTFNSCQAQNKIALENSVLWKIEHPELKAPSYLLGTIHMMCENDFEISNKINQTLENIEALVVEVNLTDPEEMKSVQELMKNTKKISEELSKKQFNQLDTLVTKVLGASVTNFDGYGITALNAIILEKMLPCTQVKYLDNELMQLAVAQKKPIYGLEKFAEQMEMLQKASPASHTVEQLFLFESYKKDFNEAITAYKKEDITTAVDLINKDIYMNENVKNLLQTNRNKNWIEKMPKMMKERSNLFAVGAAHLTGEYGLIHLLRQKGYKVTPVLK